MIASAFIATVFGLLNWLVEFLPLANNPNLSTMTSAFLSMLNYAMAWNFIFPVNTMLTVFLWVLGIEFAILGFRVLNWILGKLRGSN